MQISKFQAIVFFLLIFLMGACSKYEEGSPSMASKKSRLVNDWKTVEITANGTDITSLNLITEVVIRNDNTITVIGSPLGVSTTSNGGWAFNSDKSAVLVTNSDGTLDNYEIVMLQKDESKFRIIDNGTTIEYHFVTK